MALRPTYIKPDVVLYLSPARCKQLLELINRVWDGSYQVPPAAMAQAYSVYAM